MQNTAPYYMPVTKYLYNGKELQDDQLGGVNLDLYDYHARTYDPVLDRWHLMDTAVKNNHWLKL